MENERKKKEQAGETKEHKEESVAVDPEKEKLLKELEAEDAETKRIIDETRALIMDASLLFNISEPDQFIAPQQQQSMWRTPVRPQPQQQQRMRPPQQTPQQMPVRM